MDLLSLSHSKQPTSDHTDLREFPLINVERCVQACGDCMRPQDSVHHLNLERRGLKSREGLDLLRNGCMDRVDVCLEMD